MATTTIRVDAQTHARLRALSRASGQTITDVVRDAADALERVRFARVVRGELEAIRADPRAWAEYLAAGDALPVGDGIT